MSFFLALFEDRSRAEACPRPLPQLSETSKLTIPWRAPAHPGKESDNQKHLLIDLLGVGWQSLTQGSTSGRKVHFTLHPKSIFNSMSTRYSGKPESHRGHSGIHMEEKNMEISTSKPSTWHAKCPIFLKATLPLKPATISP